MAKASCSLPEIVPAYSQKKLRTANMPGLRLTGSGTDRNVACLAFQVETD